MPELQKVQKRLHHIQNIQGKRRHTQLQKDSAAQEVRKIREEIVAFSAVVGQSR